MDAKAIKKQLARLAGMHQANSLVQEHISDAAAQLEAHHHKRIEKLAPHKAHPAVQDEIMRSLKERHYARRLF